MIISKTPYRISFFGGGSDYPSWYQKHGGCVISTSINKFEKIKTLKNIFSLEKKLYNVSIKKIKENEYFPGFFITCGKK